jgi:hypothetical protein
MRSCDRGEWRDARGYCHACPRGRHIDASNHRETECRRCAPGHFAADPGAPTCGKCAIGQFQGREEVPAPSSQLSHEKEGSSLHLENKHVGGLMSASDLALRWPRVYARLSHNTYSTVC